MIPYYMGLVQISQKHLGEARVSFEQSAAIAPDYEPAQEMLVRLDLAEKRLDVAAKPFGRARVDEARPGVAMRLGPGVRDMTHDIVHVDRHVGARRSRTRRSSPPVSNWTIAGTRYFMYVDCGSRHQTAAVARLRRPLGDSRGRGLIAAADGTGSRRRVISIRLGCGRW